MRLIRKTLPLLVAVLSLVCAASSQEGPLTSDSPKGITPEEIIKRFSAKEKEFKAARESYTYRQEVKVQTLDGDTVTGEYRETFDVTYDNKRNRLENVVFAPQNTLKDILMMPEDIQSLRHLMPFVLTTDDVPQYDILYVGQQQEDELHCYVFDMAPKKFLPKKLYFQGRIWVDDQDFQIVKTAGKTVPETHKKSGENLFPKFTTYREQVDGQYWFPAYTLADDTLHFRKGGFLDVHIREVVKYTDYKRFGSNVKVTYEDKDAPKDQPPDQKQSDDSKPQ
jgi:hypothetical protein